MSFWIKNIFVEYQKEPLGLDEPKPHISWTLGGDETGIRQNACLITVQNLLSGKIDWDSGRMVTSESKGIVYGGVPLKPCTAYRVCVRVWDQNEKSAQQKTSFETGLLNPSLAAWDNAQWIAAPDYTVRAQTRGVFAVESSFRLENGCRRAGIVFGANDSRLLDRLKNEYHLAGENYIRYELDLNGANGGPALCIYRVGYAENDSADLPFATVPLTGKCTSDGKPLLEPADYYRFHTLRVEVSGNNATAFLDGILIDDGGANVKIKGRTLNPRGCNDVPTYPRLNEIGFFAGPGDTVQFRYYIVQNLRAPCAIVVNETPNCNIQGKETLFADKVCRQDDSFVVRGEQITADPSHTSIPMFRTVFHTAESAQPVNARLYITAHGVYDCRINGTAVTNQLLAPGLTQYDKRINYQTYDVTNEIHSGANAVGVTLASGWWSDAQTFTVRNYNYFGDKEALLCKLVLIYADGTRQVVASNTDTWQYFGQGPWLYAGYFAGEWYDARVETVYAEYSQPDFKAAGWTVPVPYQPVPIAETYMDFIRPWPAVNQDTPLLIGGYDAPVQIVDTRKAQSRKALGANTYIYDFGQEMAGVPRIVFHEKRDTKVVIRYGEMLYPNLPAYAGLQGELMTENYRDATSTDVYFCVGGETGEVFQPRFTFHGYRYLELSGIENPPELQDVESLQYSSIMQYKGSFTCSNELLNRFAENVKWSQLCNFINIPTDCPQRNERMGWAGDTHVFCHTAVQNSHLKLFYERNLQAMADLQEANGRFPEIAPIGGGFGGITYECASIFVLWELYQQYGDIDAVRKFYPGLKKYMDYMKSSGMPGKAREETGSLGDWLAPEETDVQLLWHAFYFREAVLMERLARLVKDPAVTAYAQLAEEIKTYWNKTFVETETGRTQTLEGILCDTQCSYALALEYGVVENVSLAAHHLARKVRELGHKVGTGFFGTGLLNRALSENGYAEDAYALMLQTKYPSWLYPVTQGATTIWEHWDSYTKEAGFGSYNTMNSFNHYSLGSVMSWMYEWILGIRREETCPGYSHFILRPGIGPITFAEGGISTPYGCIDSGWRKLPQALEYHCAVPANTSATLYLPDGTVHELSSGKHTFTIQIKKGTFI